MLGGDNKWDVPLGFVWLRIGADEENVKGVVKIYCPSAKNKIFRNLAP